MLSCVMSCVLMMGYCLVELILRPDNVELKIELTLPVAFSGHGEGAILLKT